MIKQAKAIEFDPEDYYDDVDNELTLRIRSLRVGDCLSLPSKVVIQSITVGHGPSQNRRQFVVVPAGVSAEDKHRVMKLAQRHCRSAAEAAQRALEYHKNAS